MTAETTGAVEPADEATELPGYRLQRLELFNWGTFDRDAWTFLAGGRNALLTGDIGSGKSTMVDAITTLLLPAQRISYNKAAGADSKERTLRSYVLGYYKSERNEQTGTSRPVALRDRSCFSVILGVFHNAGYDQTVSLAQVFWFRDPQGQPDRYYVTSGDPLTIATDFAGFGDDITALKRRLRKAGARIHDSFPPYGKDFRRMLGIESEQAMELFHQTVSMKAVGNLNDFVRSHMLEPFDAAEWTRKLVAHFDDLTTAHDAVRKARAQIQELTPLLADCDEHERLAAEIARLRAQRDALRYFCAARRVELLDRRITHLDTGIGELTERIKATERRLADLRIREKELERQRAGLGGDRLGQIERTIADLERERDARGQRAARFAELLREADLTPVGDAPQFAARRSDIESACTSAEERRSQLTNRQRDLTVELDKIQSESDDVNEELKSLRDRRSNIPRKTLQRRAELCAALGLVEDELPFAGELIQVREDCSDWEGAAERVLHAFGLSMLVPSEQYERVSDWIDAHHLGIRLVYYRVPARLSRDAPAGPATPRSLFDKLDVKESPFADWLDRELSRRADYECVDTMAQFRRATTAVTRNGQIKGTRGRHEKNDINRIDDRRNYVLGWSNQSKIDALLTQARHINTERQRLLAEDAALTTTLKDVRDLAGALARLDEFRSYAEIDFGETAGQITELENERRRIEKSSDELSRLAGEVGRVAEAIRATDAEKDDLVGKRSKLERDQEVADGDRVRARQTLTEPAADPARAHFTALDEQAGPLRTPRDCDRCLDELGGRLNDLADKRGDAQNRAARRMITKMGDFRSHYPQETAEFDASVQASGEFRALHDRLVGDDLPRFEHEFKTYLNTNTIREIAGFHAQLNKQADLIRRRIDTINASLAGIDYNPGHYIRLEPHRTINADVKQFRNDLRDCTSGSVDGEGEQYSEQKFLQVKALIERFKGREGLAGPDRTWTERVTDVRNWFTFAASERLREDDSEYENYTDSGGKSGGQKEKLAYTILAASLAYQFKLDGGHGRSKTFRFVVIDEAFGRGSDESTRFGLGLFGRLGLQLLIVTPLQKIHVIEPHVSSVGFVDNKSGSHSRLQNLTIEEYRERRSAYLPRPVPAAAG